MRGGQSLDAIMVNAMASFGIAERCRRFFLATLGGTALLAIAVGQTAAQKDGSLEHCRAVTDDAARLRCYEAATKPSTNAIPQTLGPGAGTWRLVRTRNPGGGQEAVSIMQTADITKSDIDLAGMMLRCGESGVEVLLVLVRPLPPRAHPKVTVSAAGKRAELNATVVPPGAAILLPKEASTLASGPWQAAPELAVQIDARESELNTVRGVVPLTGLGVALSGLRANCPSP